MVRKKLNTKKYIQDEFLWSWKVADCSLVDNLRAKKLNLPTFRLDAPVLIRARGGVEEKEYPVETLAR